MINRKSASSVSIAIRKTLFSLKNDQPLLDVSKKKEFTIKVANSMEERESVFKLGYQIYLDKGYIRENTNQWLINSYDTSKDTVILIVQDSQKNTVGSLTMIFDNYKGLPADKIYREELNLLRNSNERLVEISRLVISPNYRNSKEILVLLFNYMAIYATRIRKTSNIIIEVNPRHKEYYKSILCFEELGKEKPCPQVKGAPAVLLNLPARKYQAETIRCMNSQLLNKKERTLYPFFVKTDQEPLVAQYLDKQTKPMTDEEKIYFGFSESGLYQVAL